MVEVKRLSIFARATEVEGQQITAISMLVNAEDTSIVEFGFASDEQSWFVPQIAFDNCLFECLRRSMVMGNTLPDIIRRGEIETASQRRVDCDLIPGGGLRVILEPGEYAVVPIVFCSLIKTAVSIPYCSESTDVGSLNVFVQSPLIKAMSAFQCSDYPASVFMMGKHTEIVDSSDVLLVHESSHPCQSGGISGGTMILRENFQGA